MLRFKLVLLVVLGLLLPCSGVLASSITKVSAGGYHAVALRNDGTLWTWGRNANGQLGDGTTTDRSTPVQVSGLTGVITISAGGFHTVALKDDGTVSTWGWNNTGQLGDGTTTGRWTPVQVIGLTGVVAISAGGNHTVALKNDGTIWTWGYNSNGQLGDGTTTDRWTPVQVSGLTGATAISAGQYYTVALKNDGTVWTWGLNIYGQLGDGTTARKLAPVQVSGLTGVAAISAGWNHAAALKIDGTVWAWGHNANGRLGDGTTTQRLTPVQVSGLTGVAAISAGYTHTVALRNDGTVWTWGSNSNGQLGDGTITGKVAPIQVLTEVATISTGAYYTAALKDDGTVWDWGSNSYGQLGDGTTTDGSTPTQVNFDLTPPTGSVVINSDSTYTNSTSVPLGISATDDSGNVYQMRISNDGVFDTETWETYSTTKNWTLPAGDGTKTVYVKFMDKAVNESDITTDSIVLDTTPPEVFTPIATPSGWIEDDVNVTFSTTDATSGINHYEVSLDNGVFTTTTSPYVVTTEGNHTVYVKAVDNAGNSSISQVKAYITRSAPGISISKPIRNGIWIIYKVSYDRAATVNLTAADITLNKTGTADGTVSVSGTGNEARTVTISDTSGEGTLGISITEGTAVDAFGRNALSAGPSDTIHVTMGIIAVSAGTNHTVALRNNGTVWTWGGNFYGQLGDGTKTQRSTPVKVTGLTGVTAVSAGEDHTVALKSDGTVWTWGYNYNGQLGDGTKTDRWAPVQVSGLTGVIAVSAAYEHTVALKSDGTVWAWGDNIFGQLGDGTTTDQSTPVQVTGLVDVIAVSAGYLHTVALKSDCMVWDWGHNVEGQLGDGTTTEHYTPVKVTGLTGVSAISAGFLHTVALKNDGTVWDWGYNGYGQLGDGTTTDRWTPVQLLDLTGVVAVSAGEYYSIVLKGDGTVWDWGDNGWGQLGDGTATRRLKPVKVPGLTGVAAISAGYHHSVALKGDGTVWGWGDNWCGQLGDGAYTTRYTPVNVVFDWTAPTGTVVINNGNASTTINLVTLKISATDNSGTVSQMMISNDGVFDTETWGAYSTSKSWTLPPGNGTKTVYVKFRDKAGNESDVATDTIILDTTGSLHVTITSAEAVAAGAQWRRVGTLLWINSGDIENGITEGSYEIKFKKILGWGTPANIVVSIKGGETKEINATYIGAVSISKAKGYSDGTPVYIEGAIVSASFDGFFYIESDTRESGIRVEKAGHTLSVGQRVDVTGYMSTTANGERSILADTAQESTSNGTGTVKPVGMTGKMLGGGKSGIQQGVKDGYGLSNIGLLVRCWGRPSVVDGNYYISDGSKAPVKLILPAGVSIDETWQYIFVTGISSCEKVGDELQKVLLVRPGEVVTHN